MSFEPSFLSAFLDIRLTSDGYGGHKQRSRIVTLLHLFNTRLAYCTVLFLTSSRVSVFRHARVASLGNVLS